MNKLNTLLTASVLALGACQEPAPICSKNCESIVAAVAAQANTTLSDADKSRRAAVSLEDIDPSCKAAVSKDVANCMVGQAPIPGDDCIRMATGKLRQCAQKTLE